MRLLSQAGVMGSLGIIKHMNINRARVHQLIAPLVKAGMVEREGKTRGVRYCLKKGDGYS